MGSGDGILRFRDGIAIAQVILFTVSFLCAYYFRRTRRIGWFCIGVFSLLRLIGAGCMLGTVTRDSNGLWAGVFVCESLGVLLLIFTLLEMMQRINTTVPVVQQWAFRVPQILTWIDIGISIGGFVTVSRKAHDQLLPTPYSRASIAILALIFLYAVGLGAYFWLRRPQYAREERRLAVCVAVCSPLLLVRVLYSVIFVVTADLMWNAIKGSPTAYLLMTMLPEVAFVGVCTVTIWGVSPLEKGERGGKDQDAEERPMNRV